MLTGSLVQGRFGVWNLCGSLRGHPGASPQYVRNPEDAYKRRRGTAQVATSCTFDMCDSRFLEGEDIVTDIRFIQEVEETGVKLHICKIALLLSNNA